MKKKFSRLGAISLTDTLTHNKCTKFSDEQQVFIYNELYLKK